MSRQTIIHELEQRSPEWFAIRAGRATASKAADIVATLKGGGEPAARRDYRLQLVTERLTSQPQEDSYVNADMQRGLDLEAPALAAYEAQSGALVERVGFVTLSDLMVGASPDGFVGTDGTVEAKCPRPATHLKWLRAGVVPAEHVPQIVHTQLVTGRQWTDFVSYCPQFPDELRLFVSRVGRDEKAITAYELVLRQFLEGVDADLAAIQSLMLQAVA